MICVVFPDLWRKRPRPGIARKRGPARTSAPIAGPIAVSWRNGRILPLLPPEQGSPEMAPVKTRHSGTAWRHANIGRLLNNAVRRFEARVLELMSDCGHAGTRIAHVNLTRNLDVEGTRLTELAQRAAMSKQAMGELVDQCAALGLVTRAADPSDRRARIVTFTAAGLEWLDAFRAAVDIAEAEMRAELGAK